MKIKDATPEQKLKALAELDGWTPKEHWQEKEPVFVMWHKEGYMARRLFHFKWRLSPRDT